MNETEWNMFRDRVAEATSIARAAVTNVVTALSSVTVAIVGVAVTVATAERHTDWVATAMLFAIGGAGLSALAIVAALTVEAIRATRWATDWQGLYAAYWEKARNGQPLAMPWDRLKTAQLSVNVHWKVSLPAALFLGGLLAMGAAVAWNEVRAPH